MGKRGRGEVCCLRLSSTTLDGDVEAGTGAGGWREDVERRRSVRDGRLESLTSRTGQLTVDDRVVERTSCVQQSLLYTAPPTEITRKIFTE